MTSGNPVGILNHPNDTSLVPWERRWLPSGAKSDEADLGAGFLESLDDNFFFPSDNGPKALPQLIGLRCLILCGEPGMGKTSALRIHKPHIEAKAQKTGRLYWRALRETFGPQHLIDGLKSSADWQHWLSGGELTVVIDGVDEGLMLATNFIEVLVAELQALSVERLRMILTCRDAEWPMEAGRALMKLWPANESGRFQLQRLRHSDAMEAARFWGLSDSDASAFMAAVHDAAVEAFAARPITLRMLVNEFADNRRLPGTRRDIFAQGCRRLCQDDPKRASSLKSSGLRGFTAEQIMPVVQRMAALMVLCRNSAISVASSDSGQLVLDDFIPPEADESQREVVRVAISCALFCDAGHQCRTFAHQSYAEYLAACFLARFSNVQVLDLLTSKNGEARDVVPQLAEVAGWLGSLHQDFADWLIKHEPEILLRNDASSLTDTQRERLVSEFLARLQGEHAFDEWEFRRFYGSCRNPQLPQQLRPILKDRTATFSARRAAIHIARDCKVAELCDELLLIATDVETECHLREQALEAAIRLLHPDRLHELEPFARCEAGSDPHDELRGMALRTLVPGRWKVSDALPFLLLPANRGFIGEFRILCEEYLPKQIKVEDLPTLLGEFTQADQPFFEFDNSIHKIALESVALACFNLDQNAITERFVTLVLTKSRQNQLPSLRQVFTWKKLVEDSPSHRRQLVEVLIGAAGIRSDDVQQLQMHGMLPLEMDDWPWFLRRVESAMSSKRTLWASLARVFWPSIFDTAFRDDFIEACGRIPELGAELRWPLVITLDSEQAVLLKQCWQSEKSSEQEAWIRQQTRAPLRTFHHTLAAAAKDWRAWEQLAWELQRDEDGRNAFAANLDPTKQHRWQVCTDAEKEQIVGHARDYLLNASAEAISRDDDNAFLVVCWALWLVKAEIYANESLLDAVRRKWFDAFFAQPTQDTAGEQILTGIGVSLDSGRAEVCLRTRLHRIMSRGAGLARVLAAFEFAWRPEFSSILTDSIRSQNVTGCELSAAIRFLARHDNAVACSWVQARLDSTAPEDLHTCIMLALGLFPEYLFEKATSRMEANSSVAAQSLQALADIHASSAGVLEALTVDQLGDVFGLLEKSFPLDSQPRVAVGRTPGWVRIEALREHILDRLQSHASIDACNMLEELAVQFPGWKPRLRRRLRNTRISMLRGSWSGVPLEILRGMADKHESRWVRSNDDLQELVIESIHRFQAELTGGEYPMVSELWNEPPTLSPKHEIVLTQKLVRWFRTDLGKKNGIALGCQVEPTLIHETDIELSSVAGGDHPDGRRFIVTIEVKRSFNSEVKTGLEKQLIAEYLLKLDRTHGIYVVGWYKAKGWNPDRNPLRAQTWDGAKDKLAVLVEENRARYPRIRIDGVCLNCELPEAFRTRSS